MAVKCICECTVYGNDSASWAAEDRNNNLSSVALADANTRSFLTLPISDTNSAADQNSLILPLPDPHCHAMNELPDAQHQRARVSRILQRRLQLKSPNSAGLTAADGGPDPDPAFEKSPLFTHLAHGLAYTIGSALGSTPPPPAACLAAYLVPNAVGLTAGARAWSKHAHRSAAEAGDDEAARGRSVGWWGRAQGPMPVINERALALFWRVLRSATWRNLHWLPHRVLVYEVRVPEGYGMRWSQDQSDGVGGGGGEERAWMFRGFLEPTMENGHELRWRHPATTA